MELGLNFRDLLTSNHEEGTIQGLRPDSVVKSLQNRLLEEQKRASQWRALNEAAVEITTNFDSDKLPRKFIHYAQQMVFAQSACMALIKEDGQYLIYGIGEEGTWSEITADPGSLLKPILKTGRAIVVKQDNLGVPLYYKGTLIGAIVVVKQQGRPLV